MVSYFVLARATCVLCWPEPPVFCVGQSHLYHSKVVFPYGVAKVVAIVTQLENRNKSMFPYVQCDKGATAARPNCMAA